MDLAIYDPALAGDDIPKPEPKKEKFSKKVIDGLKKYIGKIIEFCKKCMRWIKTMINKILIRFFKAKYIEVSKIFYTDTMSFIKQCMETKIPFKMKFQAGKAAWNGNLTEIQESTNKITGVLQELMDIKSNLARAEIKPDDDIIQVRTKTLEDIKYECEYCRDMTYTFGVLLENTMNNIKNKDSISDEEFIRANSFAALANVAIRYATVKASMISDMLNKLYQEADRVKELKSNTANESYVETKTYDIMAQTEFFDDCQVAVESDLRKMNIKATKELLTTTERINMMPEDTAAQIKDKIDVIERHLKCIDESLKFFRNTEPDLQDKVISIVLKIILTTIQIKGTINIFTKVAPRAGYAIGKEKYGKYISIMVTQLLQSIGFNFISAYAMSYNTKTMVEVRNDVIKNLEENRNTYDNKLKRLKLRLRTAR